MKKYYLIAGRLDVVLGIMVLFLGHFFLGLFCISVGILCLLHYKNYDKEHPTKVKNDPPTKKPEIIREKKYFEVKRTKKYAEYIDYLFKRNFYYTNDLDKEDYYIYVDNVVDKYVFRDIGCTLQDNGTSYDVVVKYENNIEVIGIVGKDRISDEIFRTKQFYLSTTGGRGFEITEDFDGRIKRGEEKFYDYEMLIYYFV